MRFEYHFTSNYGHLGTTGSEYFFGYRNSGVWSLSDPNRANTGVRFDYFGLHEQSLNPYLTKYHFNMDAANYNVAGLKYLSLFIVDGIVSGNYAGYLIQPGQSFFASEEYSSSRTFDLAQQVEIPSFRIADYHFGYYPNFPVDALVVGPQDTQRQTQGARLVGGVGESKLLIAWVQEGVYRPGFALQPGYSVPRLYTYLQQYFDGAWKCDPISGNPTRLAATNWNGLGKIDTNTTASTGLINPQGGFIPIAAGKQIIRTRPLENGFYGELPFYALQMLVDKNRDGLLTTNDVTSSSNPYVFWVNNDCDRPVYTEDDLWDELELDLSTNITDAAFAQSNFRVPTLRDLEDYDRLHVRGLRELCRDLPTGQGYTISMRWKTILSGSPGIFVFKGSDADGGRGYLTNSTVANAQIAPTTYPPSGSPGISPLAVGRVEAGLSPVLQNDTYRGTNDYFIYCGTSRGAGELAVSVYKSGNLLAETSVFLDLRDVKELYERWTIGDGNGSEPATNAVAVTDGLPVGLSATQFSDPSNSGRDYIVFVHGWNMALWEKNYFAETAFKRLYWQGYTNRFGSLRWPTKYGFNDKLFSTTGPFTDPTHYDSSEFIAWKSGEGLRSHLVNLNQRYPGKVSMMAHSMGNIVAGEALALNAEKYHGGQIVNTYVASQAAVPLDCYKPNGSDPVFQMPFQYQHPKQEEFGPYLALIPGFGWILSALNGPIDWDSHTPNVYQGWLNTNRASATRRVNFYNPNDYALNMPAWGMNQLIKPDIMGSVTYSYFRFSGGGVPVIGASASTPAYFLIPSPARSGLPVLTGIRQRPGYITADGGFFNYRFLDFEFRINDTYEAMAFASEARSYPLGMLSDENALDEKLNLWTIWPTDPEPLNGIFSRHKWHSGQFRSNFIQQNTYWRTLIGLNGFRIFLTP